MATETVLSSSHSRPRALRGLHRVSAKVQTLSLDCCRHQAHYSPSGQRPLLESNLLVFSALLHSFLSVLIVVCSCLFPAVPEPH